MFSDMNIWLACDLVCFLGHQIFLAAHRTWDDSDTHFLRLMKMAQESFYLFSFLVAGIQKRSEANSDPDCKHKYLKLPSKAKKQETGYGKIAYLLPHYLPAYQQRQGMRGMPEY